MPPTKKKIKTVSKTSKKKTKASKVSKRNTNVKKTNVIRSNRKESNKEETITGKTRKIRNEKLEEIKKIRNEKSEETKKIINEKSEKTKKIRNEKSEETKKIRNEKSEEIEEYSDEIFYEKFQMNKLTFEKLYSMLDTLDTKKGGRRGYSLKQCLFITLWKLCNDSSFRELSQYFNIPITTAHSTFTRTIEIIAKFQNNCIKFPSNLLSQKEVEKGFNKHITSNLPCVLGCLGNIKIEMQQPTEYINHNYKQFSILLQGVVDSKLRFIDVYIGAPGITNNLEVWNESTLKKSITENEFNISPKYHLLANLSYPIETYLMVPYADNGKLSVGESKFNSVFNSTLILIDQAFLLLKRKFKILNSLNLQHRVLTNNIIVACVIIHNLIIDNEDYDLSSIVNVKEEIANVDNEIQANETVENQKAYEKRDNLAKSL